MNAFASFQSDKQYRELYMPLKNFTSSRQASQDKKVSDESPAAVNTDNLNNEDKKISTVTQATNATQHPAADGKMHSFVSTNTAFKPIKKVTAAEAERSASPVKETSADNRRASNDGSLPQFNANVSN